MKKIGLLVAAALLVAGVAFGQSAPKNDIYGHIQFDFDASGMRFNTNPPAGSTVSTPYYGDFTFDRMLRLGFITQPTSDLKMQVEFDFRNFELRLASFDWTPMKGLDITGGRVFKVFSPIDPYLFNNRFQAVGVQYGSGPVTVAVQLGNETDISPAFGGQGFSPSVLSGAVSGILTDPGIKLDPAIIFKPLTGKDLNATIGLNAEITLNTLNSGSTLPAAFNQAKDGTSLSAYALVNAGALQLQLEGDYSNISQDPTKSANYARLSAYGLIGYTYGPVFPNFYVIADGLNWSSTTPGKPDPNVTINFELPITVTPGLKVDPMATYAVSGYNWWDTASSTTSSTIAPKNDWMVALRFDYAFDSRF